MEADFPDLIFLAQKLVPAQKLEISFSHPIPQPYVDQ